MFIWILPLDEVYVTYVFSYLVCYLFTIFYVYQKVEVVFTCINICRYRKKKGKVTNAIVKFLLLKMEYSVYHPISSW